MSTKRNHFLDKDRASLYDQARPSFHHDTLKMYQRDSNADHYDRILDVACGTGHSTLALANFGKSVEAIDNSQAMLARAGQRPNINYQIAEAENLPFSDEFFELIFVASSLHWFNRRLFFKEAARVLKSQGKILIYDCVLKKGLTAKFTHDFNQRFPKAYNEVPLHPTELQIFNLHLGQNYRYEFNSNFTQSQICQYFYTLSSVSLSLENGEDANKVFNDIESYVADNSTGEEYIFEVSLTEIVKA